MNRLFNLKSLGLLLLSILIALSLVSCKPGNSDTPGSDTTTNAEQQAPLVLFEGENFNFKVINGNKKIDSSALTYYSKLITELKDISNADRIKTGTDATIDNDACEILFGFTDYDASRDVYGTINYNEYTVAVRENKIVIAGYDTAGLRAAMTDFVEYVRTNAKDGKAEIPADLSLKGTVSGNSFPIIFSGEVPTYKGFTKASFNPAGDDYEQITLTNTTKDEFDQYRKTLENSGFSLYTENTIGVNFFATYLKNDLMVHVYHAQNLSETRIVACKNPVLPSTEAVSYTKVCEPTFTLLSCSIGNTTNNNGLGCIIGLEDGSFIIVDGGFNLSSDAKSLYQKLQELAPDKNNILIRAWFITHAHGDHYGNMIAFSKLYSKNKGVTVESFIYNFCNTAEQNQYSSSGSFSKVTDAVSTYWSNSTVYKPLTGQVFKFPGCDMEIFYSMSDFLPNIIGTEVSDADKSSVDANIQSVVASFQMCGQSILVTGDTSKVCVDDMCKRYGEELKSDIMTVPHHGYNNDSYRARNGTKEFYKLVDPTTVMWPASIKGYEAKLTWNTETGKNEANYYLLNLLHVKKVFVAGDSHKTVTLPYNP